MFSCEDISNLIGKNELMLYISVKNPGKIVVTCASKLNDGNLPAVIMELERYTESLKKQYFERSVIDEKSSSIDSEEEEDDELFKP